MTIGTAYYDLAHCPPTWNAFDFLLAAEQWRLSQGLRAIDVRVLPGPVEGFRDDHLPPYGTAERMRWLRNIVLPMPVLLPSCGQAAGLVPFDDAPPGAAFGRGRFTVGFRTNVAAARAGLAPFRAVVDDVARYRRQLGDRYITITLRDTGWWTDRTSAVGEWLVVARVLERRGYRVVFVPDGMRPDQRIPGFETVPAAAELVLERAGLYGGAVMNLGLANGPLWFAWFMGVPVLIFVRLWENEPCAGRNAYRNAGFEPGTQLPNARPGQRLVWAPDRAALILDAFDRAIDEVATRC